MENLYNLVDRLCPNGVSYMKLADIASYKDGAAHENIMGDTGEYVVTKVKFISSDGEYRMYSNVRLSPVEKDDVIMVMSDLPNGKSLAKCCLIDANDTYTINQRVCALTADTNLVNPKFLYYVLNRNKQLLKYDNGYNQTHLKKQWILKVEIPVPPMEIQEEIVRILDSFTALISLLKEEYNCREKQYEYCRVRWLSFENVQYKTLEECCELEKGKTPIQKAIPGEFPLVVTAADRKSSSEYQFDSSTVCIPLVSSRGHGVAALNQVFYQEGKFALGNILCGVTPNDENELISEYLYYYLNHKKDVLLVPLMKGGANVSLTVNSLKGVKVPVPSCEMQRDIVNKLKPFDALLNAISNEIEARKKQYEHYLEKVLDFRAYKNGKEA